MSGCQVLNPARHEIDLTVDLETGKDEMPGTFVYRSIMQKPLLKIFPTGFLEEAFFVSGFWNFHPR